jgi:ABC-type nitrate/sulfonate/bicarbonate transport system substrate-binding protein
MKREKNGKNLTVLVIIAVLTALPLGGCAKKTAGTDKALKNFVLPYDVTGTGNPLVAVAYDLKYFEEEGLNAILQPLSTGGNVDQLMALSTGKIDVALRGWLAKQGVDLSKITFVELDGAPTIIEAVRNRSVDAGSVYTVYRQVAEQQGFPVFLHIDTLTPNFPCCRISTTGKNLEERREDYAAFFKALIRAWRFFNLDHEQSLDITDRHYDADRELLKNVYYGPALHRYGHRAVFRRFPGNGGGLV